MSDPIEDPAERLGTAILAAADSLLAVCAVQTGTDPLKAYRRASEALVRVYEQAQIEATGVDLHGIVRGPGRQR